MQDLEGRRYQLIECIIDTQQANQQYLFKPQPLLQSITGAQRVYIRAIKAYCTNAAAKSPLTPGNTVASPADIQNAFLVLQVFGTERFRYVPLAEMNNTWTDTANYAPFQQNIFRLKNIWGVDWTQSYIKTGGAVSAVPLSFLFGIYFEYSDDHLTD